jgi:hypothetical protein
MKESLPLMLFCILLLTLSISVYFGNVKIHEKLTPMDSEQQMFADDVKVIFDYILQRPNPDIQGGTGSVDQNPDDWFNQWDAIANSDLSKSNYIPKTQIVPLNCPLCQTNNGGVCTGCGGLGGKGTSSAYKNRFSDFLSTYGSGYKGNGEWAGFGGCGNRGGNGDENNPSLSSLAEKAGSGTVGLLRDTGSGAVNLLRDTGSGAAGFLKDTGSGAVGLLKDTGSGTVGLAREVGSGLFKTNPMQLNNGGYSNAGSSYYGNNMGDNTGDNTGDSMVTVGGVQSAGQSQGTIDPYSYNGALVAKGSNFIPITNDFSAFRK